MSTIRAMAATAASTASLVGMAAAAPALEPHRYGNRRLSWRKVPTIVVFLGLLGATIGVALWRRGGALGLHVIDRSADR